MGLIERAQRVYNDHGVRGVARRIPPWMREQLGYLIRPSQLGKTEKDRRWAAEHDVDVTGYVDLADVRNRPKGWERGHAYQGVHHERFARVMTALRRRWDLGQFAFVDLGSGKGKAVLLARTYPFRLVVGVEFTSEFDQVAHKNLTRAKDLDQRCGQVELICGDAAKYDLPDGPLILFMHNPFKIEVMSRVVANVGASHKISPRPIIVLLDSVDCPEPWYTTNRLLAQDDPDRGVKMLASLEALAVARPMERLS